MAKIQLKRAARRSIWEASLFILSAGEAGICLDTGEIRLGNGTDVWKDLPTEEERFDSYLGGDGIGLIATLDGKVDKDVLFDVGGNLIVPSTLVASSPNGTQWSYRPGDDGRWPLQGTTVIPGTDPDPDPPPPDPDPEDPEPPPPGPDPNPDTITIGANTHALTGTNIARGDRQMVRYTRTATQTVTPTNQFGVEVTVNETTKLVTAVVDRNAASATTGTPIPAGHYVLSGHGWNGDTYPAQWLIANAVVGATVNLTRTGTTPPVTPQPGATGPWLSGASGNGVNTGAFGTWRGKPVEIVSTWADADVSNQTNPVWAVGPGSQYANWNGAVDIAIGGIFPEADGGDVGGDTWAKAGAGNYDARWTTALNNLKTAWGARLYSNLFIRFAHEFNGDWSPWQVTDGEQSAFINAFRRFSTLAKTILPGCHVCFAPNNGTSTGTSADVRQCWPGSAYADTVSISCYNSDPTVTTQAGWNAAVNALSSRGEPVGQGAWLAQAGTWGVQLGLGEWGLHNETGEAPAFIVAIGAWIKANAGTGAGKVRYECFYNIDGPGTIRSQINPATIAPITAAQYKTTFGVAVVVQPPPSTTLAARVVGMCHHTWEGARMRDYPSDVRSRVNYVSLSLAQNAGNGAVSYHSAKPGYSDADHRADIQAFRAEGKKVTLMWGGMADVTQITNNTQADNFIASVEAIMTNVTGMLDGIDNDMETSGANWSESAIGRIFVTFKNRYGARWLNVCTPQLYPGPQEKWMSLARNHGSNIDLWNPMIYDFPEAGDSRISGVSVQKADIMAAAGIPQSKMGMLYMMRPTASYTNATPNTGLIVNALNSVHAKYPGLRGYTEWEDKIAPTRNWDLIRAAGPLVSAW